MIEEEKKSDEMDLKIHVNNEVMLLRLHACTEIEEVCKFVSNICNIAEKKRHSIIVRRYKSNEIISNDCIVLDLKNGEDENIVEIEIVWNDDGNDDDSMGFCEYNQNISETLVIKLYECILMNDFEELRQLYKRDKISHSLFSSTITLINSLTNHVHVELRNFSIDKEKEEEKVEVKIADKEKVEVKVADKEKVKVSDKEKELLVRVSTLEKRLEESIKLNENMEDMMVKISMKDSEIQEMQEKHELELVRLESKDSWEIEKYKKELEEIEGYRSELSLELKRINEAIRLMSEEKIFKEPNAKIKGISKYLDIIYANLSKASLEMHNNQSKIEHHSLMLNVATFRKEKKVEIWENMKLMIERETKSRIESITSNYYDYEAKNHFRDFLEVLKENEEDPFVVLFTTDESIFGLFSEDFMRKQYDFQPRGFLFDLKRNLKVSVKSECFLWQNRPVNFRFGGESFNIIKTPRLTPLRLKKFAENYCNLNLEGTEGFSLCFGGARKEVEVLGLEILSLKLTKENNEIVNIGVEPL